MTEELQFKSQGPHPYVFFAVPFGLVLLATAVLAIGFAPRDAGSAFGVLVASPLGLWTMSSSAYGIWGRLVIKREDNRCVVTRSLGRYSKSVEFFIADIRSVKTFTPSPGVIVWPGSAGRHLFVDLPHRKRPLAIAEGLCLSDTDLASIESLLSASDRS